MCIFDLSDRLHLLQSTQKFAKVYAKTSTIITTPLYLEKMGVKDCEMYCQPWTTRMPKAAQPNLNYIGNNQR